MPQVSVLATLYTVPSHFGHNLVPWKVVAVMYNMTTLTGHSKSLWFGQRRKLKREYSYLQYLMCMCVFIWVCVCLFVCAGVCVYLCVCGIRSGGPREVRGRLNQIEKLRKPVQNVQWRQETGLPVRKWFPLVKVVLWFGKSMRNKYVSAGTDKIGYLIYCNKTRQKHDIHMTAQLFMNGAHRNTDSSHLYSNASTNHSEEIA